MIKYTVNTICQIHMGIPFHLIKNELKNVKRTTCLYKTIHALLANKTKRLLIVTTFYWK